MNRERLVIVVGMASEARLARRLGRVVVGGAGVAEALRDGASGVLSFGLCGGLDPALAPGDLVIGSRVLSGDEAFASDHAWAQRLTRSLPGARIGAVAGVDSIVASSAAKAALHAATGAIAADMESRGAALAARDAGLPFAILRAVSDGARDSLPLSAQAGFRPDGGTDVGAVVRSLLSRPGELPGLIRTARHAGRAMTALARAVETLAVAD